MHINNQNSDISNHCNTSMLFSTPNVGSISVFSIQSMINFLTGINTLVFKHMYFKNV